MRNSWKTAAEKKNDRNNGKLKAKNMEIYLYYQPFSSRSIFALWLLLLVYIISALLKKNCQTTRRDAEAIDFSL